MEAGAAEFVDLSGDGGLQKQVLVEGSGESCPERGVRVEVHYTGTLTDGGEQFDSSRDRGQTFEFEIGRGSVIRGWDAGIASMKKGERAVLRCSADYAYGKSGSPPKIPPNASLDFDVELLSWEDAPRPASDLAERAAASVGLAGRSDVIQYSSDSEDSEWGDHDYSKKDFLPQESEKVPEENRGYVFEDRLERSAELKDEAKKLMEAGDYAEARQTYKRAYFHADFDELQTWDMQEKHTKMITDVKLPILLNLALATIKLAAEAKSAGETKDQRASAKSAMNYVNEALKLEPENTKALYRKGLAYEQLGDFEDAWDWLKKARAKMEGGSTAPLDHNCRRVRKLAKEERDEKKKVWKGKLPPVVPPVEEKEEKKNWKEMVFESWPQYFGLPVIGGALALAMYNDLSLNGFY